MTTTTAHTTTCAHGNELTECKCCYKRLPGVVAAVVSLIAVAGLWLAGDRALAGQHEYRCTVPSLSEPGCAR